jgi:DNA-binding LacI/PurR family transcriptional regulator
MYSSTVKQVASLIESDLRRRGLIEGDHYLTAEEVGRELSVHPRAASRAMRMLAKRGMLSRKRGAGTFVGPNGFSRNDIQIRCVQIIIGGPGYVGLPTGDLIDGIMEATGSRNVQMSLLPVAKQAAYVRELLESGRTDGTLSGCVLIGCLREVQEAVATIGVSTVVMGGVFPSTSNLPSVESDQVNLGYLLVQQLFRQGAKRLALVTREMWLPGDSRFHDGICRALLEAKYDHGGVLIRTTPSADKNASTEVIAQLLEQKDRPDGLICRDLLAAQAALQAADRLSLKVPGDLKVVFDHLSSNLDLGLPHGYSALSFKEQVKIVGDMLRCLMDGRRPNPEHVVIPVQMACHQSD